MTQEDAIKFKDEIKAFQEGKQIQRFNEFTNKWIDTMDPMFNHEHLYRIKQEEKPEQKRIIELSDDGQTWFEATRFIPKCEKLHARVRVEKQQTKRLPTVEEVEKWFVENKVFKENFPKTELKRQTLIRIQSLIPRGKVMLLIVGEWYTLEAFCCEYTHYDGSSLYIIE